jgi:hypothetical protein
MDAKGRQKWIDKLRTCSGTTAAKFVSIKKSLIYYINSFFSMSHHYQYQKYLKQIHYQLHQMKHMFNHYNDKLQCINKHLKNLKKLYVVLKSIKKNLLKQFVYVGVILFFFISVSFLVNTG